MNRNHHMASTTKDWETSGSRGQETRKLFEGSGNPAHHEVGGHEADRINLEGWKRCSSELKNFMLEKEWDEKWGKLMGRLEEEARRLEVEEKAEIAERDMEERVEAARRELRRRMERPWRSEQRLRRRCWRKGEKEEE